VGVILVVVVVVVVVEVVVVVSPPLTIQMTAHLVLKKMILLY